MTIWLYVKIPLWNIDNKDVEKTADSVIKLLEKGGFPDSNIDDIL